MSSARANLRGIAAMVLATASFVVCDSFMKRATEGLPPFEVLFLRGVAASLCCGLVLLQQGHGRSLGRSFNRAALLRGFCETASTLCYVVALSRMAIADAIAIVPMAPLVVILLVALIWKERVGPRRVALIAAGFAGALLVAQPDAHGFSSAALLAFGAALGVAIRDVVSRTVPAAIPALVVTFATVVVQMLGSGGMMLAFEDVTRPDLRQALYLLASGFFVTLGQLGIFLAYRLGAPGAVAPFFYSFVVWAVLSGVVVFGVWPNPLALLGIAAIVASGIGIVLLDRQTQRKTAPA
jgi:drug/metabolite transporter (DMT)-like permease